MANKSRNYRVTYNFKDYGNRGTAMIAEVKTTDARRAITKLVRGINDGTIEPEFEWPESLGEDDEVKVADFIFIDVRTDDR